MFRNSNKYLLGKNSEFGLLILEVSARFDWLEAPGGETKYFYVVKRKCFYSRSIPGRSSPPPYMCFNLTSAR